MELHIHTLLPKTALLVSKLQTSFPLFLNHFYLSGGTALSLQIGHRVSEDLDFFIEGDFFGDTYISQLENVGTLTDVSVDTSSVNVYLDSVKVQLLHYPYQLLEPVMPWEHIQISSILDVACTKLITVSQRGSKKDFVDMYFLLKQFSLQELFIKLDQKYHKAKYNKLHILKSLGYFDDANNEPMPRMLIETSWDQVKEVITHHVKSYSFI